MGTLVSFNGTNYTVPASGERAWGAQVSAYLIAIASGSLQKTGGSFTLTAADVDFGATYGLKANKFASRTTPSTTGIFRLGNAESVAWRNAGNTADLALKVNASNLLEYGGNPLLTLALGAADTALRMNAGATAYEWAKLTNANIDASAAIAYSKLNLATSIVNADIGAAAAIVDTKLATIATAGKVSNSATTAASANTASAIVARDVSGNFTAGTITAALTGNASGTAANVTGTVAVANGGTGQTAANTGFNALSPTTTEGDISFRNATVNARLGIGTAGQVLTVNAGATAPAWADGGAGAGELNAVSNPSASSATTGYTAGTSHTVARVTGSSSPLNPVIATAVSALSAAAAAESSTSGVYFSIATLPAALTNKKLKVEFYVVVPATDVWRLSVYDGSTRLVLSTDSSSVTTLPAGFTGKFTAYFDTTAATAYSVNFTCTTYTGATTLYFTNLIVGPGIQPQGAVVGTWITPITTGVVLKYGTTTATNIDASNPKSKYRRVGSTMDLNISVNFSGATTPANGTYYFSMPDGLTIDTAALPNGLVDETQQSAAQFLTNGKIYIGAVVLEEATRFLIRSIDGAGATTTAWTAHATAGSNIPSAAAVGASDYMTVNLRGIPIAEWAASGTSNLAQNDVEYAYNTAGTTAAGGSDTTAFGYGPAGAAIGSIASTTVTGNSVTSMRVRFPTATQAGDEVSIQVDTGSGQWMNVGAASSVGIYQLQGAGAYGIGLAQVSSTDYTVSFGNGGRLLTGATYASAGAAWSGVSAWKWRAVKAKCGQVVGFGNVAQSSSGLVKSAGQLLGTNTNDEAGTGYVGEYLSQSRLRSAAASLTTNTTANVTATPLTLTAGDWDISGIVGFTLGATTSSSVFQAAVSTTSATLPATDTMGVASSTGEMRAQFALAAAVTNNDLVFLPVTSRVKIAATTIFYLVAQSTFTLSTTTAYGSITARRVR